MTVVTPIIRSDGTEIDPTYLVAALDIVHEINRIPYAQIRLYDGDPATREFPISDASDFEPGKKIEIDLRYEGEDTYTVFKGVVVGHSIEVSEGYSMLVIDLKSSAIRMTFGRKSFVHRKKTDDKIISDLIAQNQMSEGTLSATPTEHLVLVQYNCTDWDFMLARADVNGLLVTVDDEEISATEIALSGSAQHTFEYGIDSIYEIDMAADAQYQISDLESVGWDIDQQKPTSPAKAKELKLQQGNLDGAAVAQSLGGQTVKLNNSGFLVKTELQSWSDSTLARSRMALIRGRVSIPGDGSIKLLDMIEIKGVSKRFAGKTLVTGVRHRFDTDGWRTDVQFGLSPRRFIQQADIIDTPASGLLPAVGGLQIGVVDEFEEDPDKLFRVKVILPGIDAEAGAVWARLATPDAGKAHGYFFWPEPGDEVVVGFFNDDPRQAVILGGLFSSKNTPPEIVPAPNADNFVKALVTRSGTMIHFDDEKKAIHIETPGKNTIVLDDDAKQIEIKDQHGNTLTLSQDGITLKSAKDFKIDASGSVEIKGTAVNVK